MSIFRTLACVWEKVARPLPRLRAMFLYLRTGLRFKSSGRVVKVRGSSAITIGSGVSIGDFCWIEAVRSYQGVNYEPRLVLGNRVAMSDLVHISCAQGVTLGDDCLIGSKVYIGDHHHGSVKNLEELATMAPAARPLGDLGEIWIGERTWIGDGAVVLSGTSLAAGSIVGANSVVRIKLDCPALVAGIPAKVIRYLDRNRNHQCQDEEKSE